MLLSDLKLQSEKLITDLQCYLNQADQIEVNKALLEDRERTNKTWEDNLQEVDTKLNNREKDLDSQKEYLNTIRKQYEVWETKLKYKEEEIKKSSSVLEISEQKFKELEIKEKDVDEKLKKLNGLLIEKSLIDIEKVNVRKHKEMLEMKEKKIKTRETQLQMDSNKTNLL
jgi:hypothetical protein